MKSKSTCAVWFDWIRKGLRRYFAAETADARITIFGLQPRFRRLLELCDSASIFRYPRETETVGMSLRAG